VDGGKCGGICCQSSEKNLDHAASSQYLKE